MNPCHHKIQTFVCFSCLLIKLTLHFFILILNQFSAAFQKSSILFEMIKISPGELLLKLQ
jgi:hypothetical protein